jgi:hypothetical protein
MMMSFAFVVLSETKSSLSPYRTTKLVRAGYDAVVAVHQAAGGQFSRSVLGYRTVLAFNDNAYAATRRGNFAGVLVNADAEWRAPQTSDASHAAARRT